MFRIIGVTMGKNLKSLFTNALLAGAASFPAFAFAQETPPPAPIKMTVRDASIIIRDANRAAQDLAMAGIINSLSSTGKVIAGTSTVDVGLSAATCEKIKAQQSSMVSLETYQAAQKIMIASGHLTEERAEQNLKTQSDFLQIAQNRAPMVAKACDDLGVKGFERHPK